ncbi:MAG: ExbD/TolR family protein [Pseudomonadota bacterium]
MSFGSLDNDDEDVMSEINMTPLVDVMLVLLIIFMITMPVLTHAVKMDLPQAKSQPEDAKPVQISLGIGADGRYTWNEDAVDMAALETRLRAAAFQQPQPELHIRADKAVVYDKVAQALSAAQRAGLVKVGFVTAPGN